MSRLRSHVVLPALAEVSGIVTPACMLNAQTAAWTAG
jgi:hypothetical protein